MADRVYSLCRTAYVTVARKLWRWFLGGLFLSYSGIIRPRGAGFYCDDRSITHTYTGDTISVVNLFLGCLLGPILFILPVEGITKWLKLGASNVKVFAYSVWKSSWRVWKALLTGILVVLVLTEFSKTLVSEARPHFMDTCKPNITSEMCSQGYVVQYTCTSNFTSRQILDSQKSFPSGHTSMSVYSALFMMWYLERAVHWPLSFLLKPCLQLLWACFAIFTSLTRITDRRHHWWDVLAGATLGVGVSFVLTRAVSGTIRSEKDPQVAEVTRRGRGDMPMNTQSASSDSSTDNSPSKRMSIRRLMSNSSATATISEDLEIDGIGPA